MSPLHRRRRRVLARYAELAERADYAMRNARVVARRAYSALLDGEPDGPGPAGRPRRAGLRRRTGSRPSSPGRAISRGPAQPVVDVVRHAKVMSDDAVALLGTVRAGARRAAPLDRAGPAAGDRALARRSPAPRCTPRSRLAGRSSRGRSGSETRSRPHPVGCPAPRRSCPCPCPVRRSMPGKPRSARTRPERRFHDDPRAAAKGERTCTLAVRPHELPMSRDRLWRLARGAARSTVDSPARA